MPRFLLPILIVALTAFAVGAQQIDETEYLHLVERADSAISKADYSQAIDLLRQAMRLEPSNPTNIMLLSNTGMLHYYMGEDSLALHTLDMAHEMAPASVTVLLNRARVNNGVGRHSQALMDYDRITQLDSTLAEPWIQKGILQLRGGDVRGAEQALAEAEKIDPNSREIFVAKAILFSRTNRPKEALPYLNQLIKKDATAEYYAERAMCRLAIDDLSGASDDIGSGLQLAPDYAELYIARALLNKRRFREKDSREDVRKALQLGANPDYMKALGLKTDIK